LYIYQPREIFQRLFARVDQVIRRATRSGRVENLVVEIRNLRQQLVRLCHIVGDGSVESVIERTQLLRRLVESTGERLRLVDDVLPLRDRARAGGETLERAEKIVQLVGQALRIGRAAGAVDVEKFTQLRLRIFQSALIGSPIAAHAGFIAH